MIANFLGILLIGLAQPAGQEAARLFPPESRVNEGRSLEELVRRYGPSVRFASQCDGVFHQWQQPDAAGRPCLISVGFDEAKGRANETYYQGEGCPLEFPPFFRTDCTAVY